MKNTINLKGFKCYWCKGMHLERISEGHYKCKSCGNVNYKLGDKDNIRFENAQSYMTNFEYEKADRIYQELYNCDERLTKIQALKLANEENKRIIKNNYCQESKENKLDLDEEFQKAEEKYEQELYEKAFEIYEKLATEYDHDESYFRMGVCYYNGYGIEQDYEKAIYCYKKAGNTNNVLAQSVLGALYYEGTEIAQDYEKAFYWLEKAANGGNAYAQCLLGDQYYEGNGITQDIGKAFYWFEKAASAEVPYAQAMIGGLYWSGFGVEEDFEEAFYWLEKAAQAGDATGQYWLGTMYKQGDFVEQDYEKAKYWYEKAADQGHSAAAIQLLLIEGSLTSESFIEAIDKSIEKREEAKNKTKEQLEKEISKMEESEKANIEKNEKIIKDLKKNKTFGKYPQTKLTDTALINKLQTINQTNELGYIEYNGKEYKEFNSNYYLVEPIKWKILEQNNNTYKLVSNVILDSSVFYGNTINRTINNEIIYLNNYEYSNIRVWLNGYNGTSYGAPNYTGKGFIDIAFTEEERKLINETLVDNSVSTTDSQTNPYVCNNTRDKIYLLSYQDVANKYFTTDKERKAKATDYAKARGVYESSNGYGIFWLRSPHDSYSSNAYYVFVSGVFNYYFVDYSKPGARPALEIVIK